MNTGNDTEWVEKKNIYICFSVSLVIILIVQDNTMHAYVYAYCGTKQQNTFVLSHNKTIPVCNYCYNYL